MSIAPEIRPSANKNPDGTLKPFYLRRAFKYLDGDAFELTIVNSADPNGAVPLARIFIKGDKVTWGELLGTDDKTPINAYTRADSSGAADQAAIRAGQQRPPSGQPGAGGSDVSENQPRMVEQLEVWT